MKQDLAKLTQEAIEQGFTITRCPTVCAAPTKGVTMDKKEIAKVYDEEYKRIHGARRYKKYLESCRKAAMSGTTVSSMNARIRNTGL